MSAAIMHVGSLEFETKTMIISIMGLVTLQLFMSMDFEQL